MPISKETLNSKLFKVLSKYDPTPLDATGKVTPMEDEADVFKFTFTKDGEEYGDVFATVDDDRQIILYYKDDVTQSPDSPTDGVGYNDSWWGFLEQLASWWPREGFSGRVLKDMSKLGSDMAKRKHMKNKDQLGEGYYPMGKKASYSDAVPTVKIVIEHSRVIEEGEQRYRNINRIFLENQEGERYLLDTKKPGIARVYARHIAEGGKVNDDRWNHVHSLCEEYSKMAGFVRATRNGQFNESAQSLVNEGIAHYQSLRESLSRMTGKRGYNAYFESWTPALMEDEGDDTNLNELFVQETLDPRIESVMPILNRIHKKVAESIVDKEMHKLAEWADSLVEEESLTSNNPVGIPEEEDVAEDLDANQKRVGQLGPTEKVGPKGAVGKLVGANENFINTTSQAVTTEEDEMDEGTHTQQDRDLNPNDYDRPNTDFSRDPIEAGTDRIHQKISSILKRLEKPKSPQHDKRDTDMGSMLEEMDKSQPSAYTGRDTGPRPGPDKEAKPISKEKMNKDAADVLDKSMSKEHKKEVNESEERPYVCVHAKKGKCEVKASSSYQAAQKAAQKWGLKGTAGIDAHLADVEKSTSSLEESTDELARILQIMNHRR